MGGRAGPWPLPRARALAEAVEGIAVTVLSGDGEAVFVNIVGDIRPQQIAEVGERLNIDPLKKLSRELGTK